jgi:hypothetical protein
MRQRAQDHDRLAVLERLPGEFRSKLHPTMPFSDDERAALRAYFEGHYPKLARRIDPVEVVLNWRCLTWYAQAHGHPEPIIPTRIDEAPDLPLGG